jgi:hypothetical protein
MTSTLDGHSFLTGRPDAACRVLWRVKSENGTHCRWNGCERLHASQSDAYNAIGWDPKQAPKEP